MDDITVIKLIGGGAPRRDLPRAHPDARRADQRGRERLPPGHLARRDRARGAGAALSSLLHLIAEAVRLGGGDLCAAGHDWRLIGGRPCPNGSEQHSQDVLECARCGDVEGGEFVLTIGAAAAADELLARPGVEDEQRRMTALRTLHLCISDLCSTTPSWRVAVKARISQTNRRHLR